MASAFCTFFIPSSAWESLSNMCPTTQPTKGFRDQPNLCLPRPERLPFAVICILHNLWGLFSLVSDLLGNLLRLKIFYILIESLYYILGSH